MPRPSALGRDTLRFMHRGDVAEDLGDVALVTTGTPPTQEGAG